MMFEQQLHDELVRAARLRAVTRSPAPFRALMAASAVAVVALGVLALVILPRSSRDSANQTQRAVSAGRPAGIAGKPAGIAPSLYDNFAIFRRPRTPADKLPARNGSRGTREQSRLVSERYGIKAWMVPGTKDVCLIIRAPTGWGSGGCGKVEDAATYQAGERPIGSFTTGPYSWRPHRRLVTLLLPDGTSDVQLRRGTKVTQNLTVENNAIQVRPMSATSIWWHAPDGSQRHITFQ